MLLQGTVRQDRREGDRGFHLPHHRLPGQPFEDEACRQVRGEASVADGVSAVHLVGDRLVEHEEVVRTPIARGRARCMDDTFDLLQPPCHSQLVGCAVPVPPKAPRSDQPREGEGYGVE